MKTLYYKNNGKYSFCAFLLGGVIVISGTKWYNIKILNRFIYQLSIQKMSAFAVFFFFFDRKWYNLKVRTNAQTETFQLSSNVH